MTKNTYTYLKGDETKRGYRYGIWCGGYQSASFFLQRKKEKGNMHLNINKEKKRNKTGARDGVVGRETKQTKAKQRERKREKR